MNTWVLVTFLVLATLVAGVMIWRRLSSQPLVAFPDLVDISDPQGHYALSVVGEDLIAGQAPLVSAGRLRLGLFSLVPQSTRFDRQSVRVFFGTHAVGSLSRADARAYRNSYGARPSRCRGLLGQKDNTHEVWLDARLGSAVASASAVLHEPALAEVFPIEVSKDHHQLQMVGDFMRNRPACIVPAQIAMSGDQAIVRIAGTNVGSLPLELAQAFSLRYGTTALGTQAYVRPSPEGPVVRLLANSALKSLL